MSSEAAADTVPEAIRNRSGIAHVGLVPSDVITVPAAPGVGIPMGDESIWKLVPS